jgi:hypothetical protein
MDYNALIDLSYEVQGQLWVDKGNGTYGKGFLCQWVSAFHPDQLPCRLEGTFHYGAFNAGMKMIFPDGTAWMSVSLVWEKFTMAMLTRRLPWR